MITGILAQLKLIQNHCEKMFLLGLFYALLCLILSIFSVKLSILLAVLGIFLILVMMVGLFGDSIKIHIDSYKELQKMESDEEEEKWRTKMQTNLKKEATPHE